MSGIVKSIYIAKNSGDKPHQIFEAHVELNKGIIGDRYHRKLGKWSNNDNKPDYNLTLVEIENISDFQYQGIDLDEAEFRRNIVTKNINLNELVNKYFTVGNVLCLGIRLCEPCRHLEELTKIKLVKIMAKRGGLRAQVLKNGIINPGDKIMKADQETASMLDAV